MILRLPEGDPSLRTVAALRAAIGLTRLKVGVGSVPSGGRAWDTLAPGTGGILRGQK